VRLPAPPHRLVRRGADDKGPERLELSVVLEGVEGVGDVDVVTLGDEVRVLVPGRWRLEVGLPGEVRPGDSTAKWVRRKSKLVLSLPLKQRG